MLRKRSWIIVALLGIFVIGLTAYSVQTGVAQVEVPVAQAREAVEPLPIRQVVLFNSGVGYLQREGEVEGDARVQLSFPVGDINDLLKSLVLQDAKGRVGVVHYDSSDPIEKVLHGFALDLTTNPTFGQLLNQARGEKVEVTRTEKNAPPSKITGAIVGMEVQTKGEQIAPTPMRFARPKPPRVEGAVSEISDVAQLDDVTWQRSSGGETEILNLHTASGLQSIPLDQIVSVRFLNPVLERELQRALQVLASAHDTQKKTVSVGFNGVGKRQVRVGYVLERPIWRTTYRLRLDDKGKIVLQGWALIENPSDDDWNDVRMVLVAGKPISFRMNLYDPIYIPRPFVEPELYASLRPPVYEGAMTPQNGMMIINPGRGMGMMGMPMGGGMGMGGMPSGAGMFGMSGGGMVGAGPPPDPTWVPPDPSFSGLNRFQQQTQQALERRQMERMFHDQNKLTYDELQRRRAQKEKAADEAQKKGPDIAGFNFEEGIKSIAHAAEVGDYHRYTLDQKISVPRQKSAMLPIVDQAIEGQKISIYNPAVHAKHPLLGLRLKNTSGQPLTQGPITVYDGGVFGGDTRILDLQPNEERLLSYALDPATEVKTEFKEAGGPDMHFRLGDELRLSARYVMRHTHSYLFKNRSTHDRIILIEQPIRSDWTLVEPKKPLEATRDLYRFQVGVPAGQVVRYDVIEEQARVEDLAHGAQFRFLNGITVKVEGKVDLWRMIDVKIAGGIVQPTYRTRHTTAYFVQNLTDIDRTFTVDYPIRTGWTRLEAKKPQEGPSMHQFTLKVGKGQTATESIREERVGVDGTVALKLLDDHVIRSYLTYAATGPAVKAAMTKVLTLREKVADTQREINSVSQDLHVINGDHARVRENLKIVPMTSEHYKPLLDKFVAQDRQIETLQANLRQLNATLQARRAELDQFQAKVDAE